MHRDWGDGRQVLHAPHGSIVSLDPLDFHFDGHPLPGESYQKTPGALHQRTGFRLHLVVPVHNLSPEISHSMCLNLTISKVNRSRRRRDSR